VCCSVLQCVAVCCSVLQSVTVCNLTYPYVLLQCVAVCCSLLQSVAVCFSVVQCGAYCRRVLHYVPPKPFKLSTNLMCAQNMTYSCSCLHTFIKGGRMEMESCVTNQVCQTLQHTVALCNARVVMCCSVLQCVAVCCSVLQRDGCYEKFRV